MQLPVPLEAADEKENVPVALIATDPAQTSAKAKEFSQVLRKVSTKAAFVREMKQQLTIGRLASVAKRPSGRIQWSMIEYEDLKDLLRDHRQGDAPSGPHGWYQNHPDAGSGSGYCCLR